MEKTVFLFRRHPARSRDNFGRYYIQNHAPLGARLTRCLRGYTVNLVQSESRFDAITEHWVPEAMDILTPEKAYATQEDFDEVLRDDQSLFSGFDLYVVDQEIETMPGAALDSPLRQPTPEMKFLWFYRDAQAARPPPPGARRVVDNRVRTKLVFNDGACEAVAPEFALIRMAWAPSAGHLGPYASDALVLEEYRFIPAPAWSSGAEAAS